MQSIFDLSVAEIPRVGDSSFDFKSWLRDSPAMFVLRREEESGRFGLHFADSVRPFLHRMTGGCGNLAPEFWAGMKNLAEALSGALSEATDARPALPRMSGVGLFGGTRMLYKADPNVIRPGVTEIFPAVAAHVPAVILGILVRTAKFRQTDRGLVVGDEGDKDFFTILHPKQQACAIVQDSADAVHDDKIQANLPVGPSPWDLEYRRCADIRGELLDRNWGALLSVYNGGGVTEKELKLWAEHGKQSPGNWNILLYKGSGGVADKYASDEAWLAEHPDVHVCGLETSEIRAKLLELNAITYDVPHYGVVTPVPSGAARGTGVQDYRKRPMSQVAPVVLE